MMKTKKFIAIGLLSMVTLTGCFNQSETASTQTVDTALAPAVTETEQSEANPAAQPKMASQVDEEAADKETEKEAETQTQQIKDIIALTQLMGKKQTDVAQLLGKAEETKNLENTEILLADYYTQNVLEQAVKIEIVYNDDKGEVNFVNMTCKQTDDVTSFVEAFSQVLTAEFGESSIEKITNVRGTRRREWEGSGMTYVLSYLEDTVTLDMYTTDK